MWRRGIRGTCAELDSNRKVREAQASDRKEGETRQAGDASRGVGDTSSGGRDEAGR